MADAKTAKPKRDAADEKKAAIVSQGKSSDTATGSKSNDAGRSNGKAADKSKSR